MVIEKDAVVFASCLAWTLLLSGPTVKDAESAHRRLPLLSANWIVSATVYCLVDTLIVFLCCVAWLETAESQAALVVGAVLVVVLVGARTAFRRKACGSLDACDHVGAAAYALLDAGASVSLFVVWLQDDLGPPPWVLVIWWVHIALSFYAGYAAYVAPQPRATLSSAATAESPRRARSGSRRDNDSDGSDERLPTVRARRRDKPKETINVTCPACQAVLYIDDNV